MCVYKKPCNRTFWQLVFLFLENKRSNEKFSQKKKNFFFIICINKLCYSIYISSKD